MSEPLIHLADLPAAAPDPTRAERVRMRCRTRLARQVPPTSAPRPAPGGAAMPIWQPLVVLVGVGYLAEVVRQALRVYGLL